jgi:hypothetical protein
MPQPPKMTPQRRNPRVGPVYLPASGRSGVPPKWPLAGRQSAAEKRAWEQLWATPQAVAWERLGWTRTVARYCRVMVASEKTDASPALLAQATSMEDRLGLTPKSMRLMLWEIAADEVSEAREEATAESRRRTLRAVDPDAVAGG